MNQKLLSDLDLGGPGDLRSDLRGHPRPSEAEVLPEGLDVFLGVLDGHVDGVFAVAAEGSGLRV